MKNWIGFALFAVALTGCEVLVPDNGNDNNGSLGDAGSDVDPEVDADDFVPPEPVEGRTRGADEMPQVLVEAGSFEMGREDAGDESPVRSVTISADFWMDRHEVTVGQWQTCVDDGGCDGATAGTWAELGSCNWQSDFGTEVPMNCVGSVGAEAYCSHVGAQLPTEAQWEYAARGTDGRRWAWGDTEPDCRTTVWSNPRECDKSGSDVVEARVRDTSPWGVRDMGGNVREWVQDSYLAEAYETLPDTDPVYFAEDATHRVHRGGYFGDRNIDNLRATYRHRSFPDTRQPQQGFRCIGGQP
jgi:formylglycine-generating enzyme required for sulfatase activity